MNPTGEVEESIIASLIADEGKLIRHKSIVITEVRVGIVTGVVKKTMKK